MESKMEFNIQKIAEEAIAEEAIGITKSEIDAQKLTMEEVSACVILSEILKSVEYNKLQYKGQILHRYDKQTLTNLDNFKDADYLMEILEKMKKRRV